MKIEQDGCVDFPVGDPRYQYGGGTGMFVRVVVVPPEGIVRNWMKCSGGGVTLMKDECYLRDDLRRAPDDGDLPDNPTLKQIRAQDKLEREYEEYHWPYVHKTDRTARQNGYRSRHESRDYLAVLTIGSCRTTFYDGKNYWHCTYEDLTPEGKDLYNGLKALYKGCEVLLQTWMDT